MNALPGIPYLKGCCPRQQSVVHKLNAEHQGASLSRLHSLSPRDAVLRSDQLAILFYKVPADPAIQID